MLPIRNISYLLPMCCSFWEKCKNSPKTGLGCSTPLNANCRSQVEITWVNCKWRKTEIKLAWTFETVALKGWRSRCQIHPQMSVLNKKKSMSLQSCHVHLFGNSSIPQFVRTRKYKTSRIYKAGLWIPKCAIREIWDPKTKISQGSHSYTPDPR